MAFNEPAFLFAFLPVALGLYMVLPAVLRNYLLLLASFLFYFLGEPRYLRVMAGTITFNYCAGLWLANAKNSCGRRWILLLALAGNLGVLGWFKYTNFLVENCNHLLGMMGLAQWKIAALAAPLGISFYTFHAISYVLDVYQDKVTAQRNPFVLALYFALFPKMVAGPIIRYGDMAAQLIQRTMTRAGFAWGTRRFIIGLGKKVIIANTLAGPADQIFGSQALHLPGIPADQLTTPLAWLATVCYTLQIYFDFSGYSDMAIGLGGMLGFHFPENFNFPYVAGSVTEFWRRWHISLSNWFRDYVFLPLEMATRHQLRPAWRTALNLMLTMLLCGLWHGASWGFVLWGLYHGLFLALERQRTWTTLTQRPVLRHGYGLLAIMIGWVLFRAETLEQAGMILRSLAGFAPAREAAYSPASYLGSNVWLALLAGLLSCAPWVPLVRAWLARPGGQEMETPGLSPALHLVATAFLLGVLGFSVVLVAGSTYHPFIYFRF